MTGLSNQMYCWPERDVARTTSKIPRRCLTNISTIVHASYAIGHCPSRQWDGFFSGAFREVGKHIQVQHLTPPGKTIGVALAKGSIPYCLAHRLVQPKVHTLS